MKTFFAILSLGVLSFAGVRAEDSPAIELKNKSAFTMDSSGRNPFWPIGWKPVARSQTNTTEHTGPDILSSAFVVSSLTLAHGAPFAIMNGKGMRECQVFGLQLG